MAGLRVGLREDGVEVRDARVRDEALRPVEDVIVALAPRRRAHRGRVGAGARLGERVGREPLAAREPRQEALLLLLRARQLDARASRAPARRGSARTWRRPSRPPRSRPAAAARPFRCRRAPRRRGARRCRARGRARRRPTGTRRLVDLGGARRDPLAREVAHEVADLALLVGERVARHRAHSRSAPSLPARRGRPPTALRCLGFTQPTGEA